MLAGAPFLIDFHVHFADDPDYSRYNFGQLNFWRVLSLATLWYMAVVMADPTKFKVYAGPTNWFI